MSKKAKADPLASPMGRQFLERHLAEGETALKHGPDGGGWQHNETLKPEIEEGVAFLRALLATLPK